MSSEINRVNVEKESIEEAQMSEKLEITKISQKRIEVEENYRFEKTKNTELSKTIKDLESQLSKTIKDLESQSQENDNNNVSYTSMEKKILNTPYMKNI